ncbi:MAG: hypothetical protein JRD05_00225 [Deltaproteobacteria bacterium]|nr:hypothetical protein [Deltaproteobacteria bacterium]
MRTNSKESKPEGRGIDLPIKGAVELKAEGTKAEGRRKNRESTPKGRGFKN